MNKDLRELSITQIEDIVTILKSVYKRERRRFICLYFLSWLAKEQISPMTAAKILKRLSNETKDKRLVKEMLNTIRAAYSRFSLWDEDVERYLSNLLKT